MTEKAVVQHIPFKMFDRLIIPVAGFRIFHWDVYSVFSNKNLTGISGVSCGLSVFLLVYSIICCI